MRGAKSTSRTKHASGSTNARTASKAAAVRSQEMLGDRMKSWLTCQWLTLRSATKTQWALFLLGTLTLATGIGAGILPSSLGAGPVDAFFAGAADVTPFTVGTVVMAISVGLVVFAWILGTPPLVGTFISFFLFGILVDLALFFAPAFETLPAQIAQWLVGVVLLAVGAGLTIGSGVGASAVDMATVAIASKIGGRLGLARVLLDSAALAVAFAVGGPIAWGTLGLAVLFPLIMPRVVQHAKKLIPPTPTQVLTPAQ